MVTGLHGQDGLNVATIVEGVISHEPEHVIIHPQNIMGKIVVRMVVLLRSLGHVIGKDVTLTY